MVDDRDYSSTLLLVEDDQYDTESTLAALSDGRPIEGVFVARDGAEATTVALPGLTDQPSSAAEREL
jgi:hypothetical protein